MKDLHPTTWTKSGKTFVSPMHCLESEVWHFQISNDKKTKYLSYFVENEQSHHYVVAVKKFSQKQQTFISVQEPKLAFLDVLHRVRMLF